MVNQLIHTLSEYGITASYDKVICFRKSAANYVDAHQGTFHKVLGLTTDIGHRPLDHNSKLYEIDPCHGI